MPLDVQLFREDQGGKPELLRTSQKRRNKRVEDVDDVIKADTLTREYITKLDNLNKKANHISKSIGEINKKSKGEKRALTKEEEDNINKLKQEKLQIENEQIEVTKLVSEYERERDKIINRIGNIVHDDVPTSVDEKDNGLIKKWGNIPKQTGKELHHHELLWMIKGYEPDSGTKVAGHRGYFLTGPGVLLNMALQNYGVQFLVQRKYTPVYPPFFMNQDIMGRTAQLEDFDEQLYKVKGESEDTDKYLIATSEQPISAMHYNEWMEPDSLPIKYAGISTCFRKEAGAHGKDAWGIFRVHQFDKIEQFIYCAPDQSWKFHEELIQIAEEFYQTLNLPYQIVSIVSGSLNNAAAKKYDLEAWFPAYDKENKKDYGGYRELVSCSNCTDYQSRGMNTRYGFKKMGDREKTYVHMLNATLCATTRTLCCILENYQTETGIKVPDVLQKYCGTDFLPFTREKPKLENKNKNEKPKQQEAKEPKEKHQTEKPIKEENKQDS